jgi:hypothetical protein
MSKTVISIHDAKIRTVSVGIGALTISDRQVTLAVFRQLIEEPLIDQDTCSLNGLPWGFVNYHDNKNCPHDPHKHYVWQRGDELRRATHPEQVPRGGRWNDIIARWAIAELQDRRAGADNQRPIMIAEPAPPGRSGRWKGW